MASIEGDTNVCARGTRLIFLLVLVCMAVLGKFKAMFSKILLEAKVKVLLVIIIVSKFSIDLDLIYKD